MARRTDRPPVDADLVRRLRAEGYTWEAIARKTKQCISRLRYAVDPEVRAKSKAWVKRSTPKDDPQRHHGLIERRPTGVARGFPLVGARDPTTADAVAAFARGEIDRAELMRRIGKKEAAR